MRLSAHILGQDRDQVPSQLYGRLLSSDAPGVKNLLGKLVEWEEEPWIKSLVPSLDQAGGPLIRTLVGHSLSVDAVSVTPDGKRAVSGSSDQTLKVWDLETGSEIQTLKGHSGLVLAVSVTPDGKRAVSGSSDQTLKVWDLETGEEIQTLQGHSGWVTAVTLTPDGKRAVSGSRDHTLKVWDLETGEEIQTLQGHSGSVYAVSVTPDGKRAVSGSDDKTLKVWDLETGEEIQTLQGHSNSVSAVSVTPDGKRAVSGSDDYTLKVWDLEKGEEIASFSCDGGINACALSERSGLVVVAGDQRGIMHFLQLEHVMPGVDIVTAWHAAEKVPFWKFWRRPTAFGCPRCRKWSEISRNALGTEILCPECGKPVRLNPFVIQADWRPVAEAWQR